MITLNEIKTKIDSKTKPIGSLGILESIATQLSKIQNNLNPTLSCPTIFIFAGDHGIAKHGVSAYPQEVTWQMVHNFVQGGAAINVLARQHQIVVKIVDTGVNYDFKGLNGLIHASVGNGTKSFLTSKAMTKYEFELCLKNGKNIIRQHLTHHSTNIIGFGEMGIGNTSAASLIMHCLTKIPLQDCIGKGTGLNDSQLTHKQSILSQSLVFHSTLDKNDVHAVMQTFGGFEITTMVAAILESYEHNLCILIDGFIASVAFLIAYQMHPSIKQNTIFCHLSDEKGHRLLLQYLEVSPILQLHMRLGEGSGCAVAYPIIESAVNMMNQMASFESAGVSTKGTL